jgi:acyl carrier protein
MLPDLADGPAQIKEWDSLGALRILLAVEEDLGVTLGEQDMAKVRTVADLVATVDEARSRKATESA